MTRREFEELVRIAVEEIPNEFLNKLENVDIVTQDWPNEGQINFLRKRGERGMLLGLYEGVPQTRRGRYGIGGSLPDKITIFIIPLLRISGNIENLKKNIRDTVVHEIGHHFGMSEKEIRQATKSLA
jgi:predicted Zn-dependent protease with MMP-like domain